MRALFLVSFAIFFFSINLLANKKPNSQKPNIIIIYTDDMGLGDVAFAGGTTFKTPNLDKMAGQGKVYTQYYTGSPVCSPSRVAITTGMYPLRWNINTFLNTKKMNSNYEQSDFLDSSAPSIAKCLKQVGYNTAHIGKWHMGGGRDVNNAPSINSYGFDKFLSTWESPQPDPVITSTNWIWAPTDSVKRWNRTAYFVDKSIDFLKSNGNNPFFLNLWPDEIHTPWVPDVASQAKPKSHQTLENFQRIINDYDKQMGRFFDYLETSGLMQNTIVIFTSDNGPSPGFERIRTNGKKGVKNSLYEGGINMPFFICWPKQIKGGQVDSTSIISAIDLLPTLCKISGAKTPSQFRIDGEDVSSSMLSTKTYKRKNNLYWEYGRNSKYNFPDSANISLQLCVRSHNWKLFTNPDGLKVELYNLATDPNESNNVAAQNSDIVNQLKPNLVQWYKTNDKQQLLLKKQ